MRERRTDMTTAVERYAGLLDVAIAASDEILGSLSRQETDGLDDLIDGRWSVLTQLGELAAALDSLAFDVRASLDSALMDQIARLSEELMRKQNECESALLERLKRCKDALIGVNQSRHLCRAYASPVPDKDARFLDGRI